MRESNHTLTECEAEIMDVAWTKETFCIQDIVDSLSRPLAYTTVMTMVKILEEKGFVERVAKRGRAFVYKTVVTKARVRNTMTRDLVERLFGGSMKSLVLNLVSERVLSQKEIEEVRLLIEKMEKKP